MKGFLLVVLLLTLLSACDNEPTQVPEGSDPAAEEAAVDSTSAEEADTAGLPLGESLGEAVDEPIGEAIGVPLDEQAVEPPVAEPAEPATPEPPKPRAASRPAPAPTKPAEEAELAEPALDLSLPEDWTDTLQPDMAERDAPLLPPLFESPASPPLQLGGRILADDDQEEIQGAEISIEFRR